MIPVYRRVLCGTTSQRSMIRQPKETSRKRIKSNSDLSAAANLRGHEGRGNNTIGEGNETDLKK